MTAAVLDNLAGLVTRVVEQKPGAGEPEGLYAFSAFGGNLDGLTKWQPDLAGSGTGFDREQARMSAIGEYMERYSANYVPPLPQSTYKRLLEQGQPALEPDRLFPFGDQQSVVRSGQFRRPNGDSLMRWATAQSRQGLTLIPASLVYLNYYRSHPDEPRYYPVMLPGIAAGKTFDAALASGTFELLERDATMRWWLAHRRSRPITLLPETLSKVLPKEPGFDFQAYLLASYNAGPAVHVVAGVLFQHEPEAVYVGFAARPSQHAAILKAASEAWQLRGIAQALRNPSSWIWETRPDGSRPMPLIGAIPDENTPLTQLIHNLEYYLGPGRTARAAAKIVELADESSPCDDTGEDDVPTAALDLHELATRHGLDVYWADATTGDVRALGFSVVRSFCPQAVPNLPTAFPPLGNQRLLRAISESGLGINTLPLPHA